MEHRTASANTPRERPSNLWNGALGGIRWRGRPSRANVRDMSLDPTDRRRFLALVLAAPFASTLIAQLAGIDEAAAAEARLVAVAAGKAAAPTPECGDDDEPTPRQTEGPFFKPSSPERVSLLEPGMKGTRIEVAGRVYGPGCKPIAGALVDFWQADGEGEYDNDGFRCRGHQFTDAEGRYRLSSVVPGLYPGRTRHFHVRVQRKGGRILTTQLYFPGEARNRRDGIFRQELLMAVDDSRAPWRAGFHFLLEA
jgi:protocatechuate 3,4-dioxygenase beta subunit